MAKITWTKSPRKARSARRTAAEHSDSGAVVGIQQQLGDVHSGTRRYPQDNAGVSVVERALHKIVGRSREGDIVLTPREVEWLRIFAEDLELALFVISMECGPLLKDA